jgi:hypothetical protein
LEAQSNKCGLYPSLGFAIDCKYKGETMDVYVIEVGQYSDKSIVGVASTVKRAQEIITEMKKFYDTTETWYKGEDFNIYKHTLDALPRHVEQKIYEVTFFTHEDRWYASQVTSDYFEELPLNKIETWDATNSPTVHRPAYRVLITVDDEETALKAGTERILQFITKETL